MADNRPWRNSNTSSARESTSTRVTNAPTENQTTCRSGPRKIHARIGEAADVHERANGRLFREVEFALPRELNEGEQIELAREFARRLNPRRQRGAVALHAGRASRPGGEPPCPPDDLGAGQRWHRAGRGAVVPALQRQGPGEGRGSQEHGNEAEGLAGGDPQGLGRSGEPGAGAGGEQGADS